MKIINLAIRKMLYIMYNFDFILAVNFSSDAIYPEHIVYILEV